MIPSSTFTFHGPPIEAQTKAILEPYGEGGEVVSVLLLPAGPQVQYSNGRTVVFSPVVVRPTDLVEREDA